MGVSPRSTHPTTPPLPSHTPPPAPLSHFSAGKAAAKGERLFSRASPRQSIAARAARIARGAVKAARLLRTGAAGRRRAAVVAALLVAALWSFGKRADYAREKAADAGAVGGADGAGSWGGGMWGKAGWAAAGEPAAEAAVVADGGVEGLGGAVEGNVSVNVVVNAAMKTAREQFGNEPVSMVVLFHNEYDTLLPVLDSWIEGGLTDYVQEILFYLNGVKGETEFYSKVSAVKDGRIPKEKVRVMSQHPNLPLGLAIRKMVESARSEFVLLMEKDWKLVEPREVMISRLRDSKIIVGSGAANLVRHRHRDNPGVPIHALIMHAGREESILRQQTNLLCFAHHWQKDPSEVFPGKGIMSRCGGSDRGLDEEDVFCTPARYCQWTNNPGFFKKTWFLSEIGDRFVIEYKKELEKEGPKSPFLDFEYYTNWRGYAWNDRNITVATGAGLFSHTETEHQHFNTFWYAYFRLTTDLEEIGLNYLKNETLFKQLGGVHYHPDFPKPPPLTERYPVEFVRKYQVPNAFAGSFEEQKKLIDKVYEPYVADYRVQHGAVDSASRGGLFSVDKAKKPVPWRNLVTHLHFNTEKAMMMVAPEQPHEMTTTLVTSLLDLDRHTVDRDFSIYMDAMQDWLKHEYNKVVYTSQDIATKLLVNMSAEAKETTKFIYTSREELRTKWIGPDNYDRIQELRKSESWYSLASWLRNSPQAKLADYNPMVMSKMFMMRDVARSNPWNTSHFLYIDTKHNCRNPTKFSPRSDHIVRSHMFAKLLLTYFDYLPATEVHGFEYAAFNKWVNINSDERKSVYVGRGGIIGGSRFIIEALTAMYDVVLTASLREGLMGTEENILSILMAQVPQYINPFSNDYGCRDNLAKDHRCSKATGGYNCAIFTWAVQDAPEAGPERDPASVSNQEVKVSVR